MDVKQILQMGGYPDTPEGRAAFYKEYPTEDLFVKKFGGVAFPQAATADQFFSHSYTPSFPRGYYEDGGATNNIAFPQQPPADYFFSAYPWSKKYGGLPGGPNEGTPCMECGGSMQEGGSNIQGGSVNSSAFGYGQFPAIMDLGGEDSYKKGGWIGKVSKSMERKGTKGSFTKYCGGKVTDECIQRGLNSPDPLTRKRAGLAKAFRKISKKQEGGEGTDATNGLDPNDIGKDRANYFMDILNRNRENANMDEMIDEAMQYDNYLEAADSAIRAFGGQGVSPGINYGAMNSDQIDQSKVANANAWEAYNKANEPDMRGMLKDIGQKVMASIGLKKLQRQTDRAALSNLASKLPQKIGSESMEETQTSSATPSVKSAAPNVGKATAQNTNTTATSGNTQSASDDQKKQMMNMFYQNQLAQNLDDMRSFKPNTKRYNPSEVFNTYMQPGGSVNTPAQESHDRMMSLLDNAQLTSGTQVDLSGSPSAFAPGTLGGFNPLPYNAPEVDQYQMSKDVDKGYTPIDIDQKIKRKKRYPYAVDDFYTGLKVGENIFNKIRNRPNEQKAKEKQMFAEAIRTPLGEGDVSQGYYDPNLGNIQSNKTTVGMYGDYGTQYGGSPIAPYLAYGGAFYQEGGAMMDQNFDTVVQYVSEKEIENMRRAGIDFKFLD